MCQRFQFQQQQPKHLRWLSTDVNLTIKSHKDLSQKHSFLPSLEITMVARWERCAHTHKHTQKIRKTCYILPPKPINQYSVCSQTPVVHTFPNCPTVSDAKGQWLPFLGRPTLREGRTGLGKSFTNSALGHEHLCLPPAFFSPPRSSRWSLQSVNLSLRGLRAFTLMCRRTEEGNERRVVKDESG